MKQYEDITDPSLAKALAHPLRTRILSALEHRTASPSELAEEFDASLGVVSYHVRRLHSLRFLKLVKSVPRRGAVEHYYTAVARPRITSKAWEKTPTIVKQATVAGALQEVGLAVTEGAAAGGFEQPQAHLSRSPITVDQKGFDQIAAELDAIVVKVRKIEAESAKRLAGADPHEKQSATVVLMLFNSPSAEPGSSERGRAGQRRRTRSAGRKRAPTRSR